MIKRNRNGSQRRPNKTIERSQASSRQLPLMWILVCLLSSTASFYGGLFVGWHSGKNTTARTEGESNPGSINLRSSLPAPNNEIVSSEPSNLKDLLKDATSQISELKTREMDLKQQLKYSNKADKNLTSTQQALPHLADVFDVKHTGDFASGMEFVDRDDFAAVFDTGVPLDETSTGNNRVLLLYSDKSAFPNTGSSKGLLSAEEATSNCHNLNLILTHGRRQQCIAIMGQYESFHIHKYMRVDGENGKIVPSLPLRYASRGHQQNGRISAKLPTIAATKEHWNSLVSYLQSLDKALDDLKPLLEEAASHNDNNAVIVMVCNFGQSELLLNFICNARAKGLENILSNILLFATDQATHDLAQLLGITSVYIESIFADMPENAARQYADRTFRSMMTAKVYCIHMVSMLGYDILFQDVDVVWYQNPFPWFHDETNPHYGFDMYFQDDGNHALFYAPYSANTGFYYVRNNERTKYFFNSFLMAGDKIISSGSHQIPLIAHLSEHASLHGLRVKTWERNQNDFPGGFTFHNKKHKNFMKDLMSGAEESARGTYVFHMSWTQSKINKVKFYQQMGEWYLQDTCVSRYPYEIKGPEDCCAVAPILTCHFRDKPSKIPCKDSPPIDKGKGSWW